MSYFLFAHPRAQRELDGLPPVVANGLRAVLRALADSPRSRRDLFLRGVDGQPPALRLPVGDYRVILRIDHAAREVVVARVGHRRDVPRGLGKAFDWISTAPA